MKSQTLNATMNSYEDVMTNAKAIDSMARHWTTFDQSTWNIINGGIQAIDAFGKTAAYKSLPEEKQHAIATGAMVLNRGINGLDHFSFAISYFAALTHTYVEELKKHANAKAA